MAANFQSATTLSSSSFTFSRLVMNLTCFFFNSLSLCFEHFSPLFTSLRMLCSSRLLAEQAALRTGVELGWARWGLGCWRWGVAGAEGKRPQLDPAIEKPLPSCPQITMSFNCNDQEGLLMTGSPIR